MANQEQVGLLRQGADIWNQCRVAGPTMGKSQIWGEEIPIGKFFQRTDLPALHQAEPILDEGGPLALRDLGIPPQVAKDFIAELM